MGLYLRLLAITVACTALALLALAILLGGQLGRTLTNLHLQRLSVVVEDTRDTLETGLAWGAPLAAFDAGDTLLRRLNDGTRGQTAIVIDREGNRILPRRDPEAAVDETLLRLANRLMKSPEGRADIVLPERIIKAAAIRSAHGEPVAALIVAGERAATFASERAFFLRITPLFLLILAVAAAAQAIVFAVLLKPVRAYLAQVADMTKRLATGQDSAPEADPQLRDFAANVRRAQRALSARQPEKAPS